MDRIIRERYHDDILHEVMRRYAIALGDIETLGGFESFIYRFTRDGAPFILRVTHSHRRTPELIHGEVDWINYLAAGGATVARAVESARGELVEEVDDGAGGRFLATAFANAPGRPAWEMGWTPSLRQNYGRLIGRMHALTKRYTLRDPAWRRPAWPAESLPEVVRHLSGRDGAALDRYRALAARVAALPRDRDGYGLIHFDAHESNFHVDGETITLFDFDDCGYNWLVNDIAMVIFYQVTNRDDPEDYLAGFLPDFLRGYRAENRLDPAWLAAIPDFLTMREIELYAIIQRSYDVTPDTIDQIPHAWPRRFMEGRAACITAGAPYIAFDLSTMADYL